MKTINFERLDRTKVFIEQFERENGRVPTLEEICKACGQASQKVAHEDVYRLRAEQELGEQPERGPLLMPEQLKPGSMRNLQILGEVRCGWPNDALENVLGSMLLPEELLGKGAFFMLRARGQSMRLCGIEDGDLLVVKKVPEARDGDIVVCGIGQNEATVKVFHQEKGRFWLSPCTDVTDEEGHGFEDIPLSEAAGWQIFGRVELVLHRPRVPSGF